MFSPNFLPREDWISEVIGIRWMKCKLRQPHIHTYTHSMHVPAPIRAESITPFAPFLEHDPLGCFLLRLGRGDLRVQLLHQVLPLAEYRQPIQLAFDFGYK